MITSWLLWFSDVASKFKPLQPRGCWRSSPALAASRRQHMTAARAQGFGQDELITSFGVRAELWQRFEVWRFGPMGTHPCNPTVCHRKWPWTRYQRSILIHKPTPIQTVRFMWSYYNMLIADSDPSQASMLNTLNVRWFGTWACLKIGYLQNLMINID